MSSARHPLFELSLAERPLAPGAFRVVVHAGERLTHRDFATREAARAYAGDVEWERDAGPALVLTFDDSGQLSP